MSNCIKDLYDYGLVKKCSKCGIISLKSTFHKRSTSCDGYNPQCKFWTKKYYIDNQDRLLNKQKLYYKQNLNKINTRVNEYVKNTIKTDVNFRLFRNTRRRIHHALNGKSKSISTKEILGTDIEAYKKWIEFQMTPDMTWDNIEIDHVKAICMFDVSDDEKLKEAFSWKNTQPYSKKIIIKRVQNTKFIFLDYQLQFIKPYQFIKLNEERFNENIH